MFVDQSSTGFLTLLSPQIETARRALRAELVVPVSALPALLPDVDALVVMLFAGVRSHLERMVTPTLALELNVARLRGELRGGTPEERFTDYLDRLGDPDYRSAAVAEYPALIQLAAERLALWVDVSREWVNRLVADWESIVNTFFGGKPPGAVVGLRFPQRSTKRFGQAVVLLEFASGARLAYKPRSLAVEVAYQALLQRLNETGFEPLFRPLTLLDRETHGWMAWAEPGDCATVAEVRRFYRRQGAHLALFYTLEATDLHMSNVIAAGEHPALIDLETLFHPRAAAPDWSPLDLALDDAIYYSVLRPGLLPEPETANEGDPDRLDLSGLTGAGGQRTPYAVPMWRGRGTDALHLTHERKTIGESKNRPTLRGEPVDALAYLDALDGGFADAYRWLVIHRDELSADDGLLSRFAGVEVRILPRSGRRYGAILESSYHPDLLRDPAARRLYIEKQLRRDAADERDLLRLIPHELRDLAAGDTPLFTGSPDSRDVIGSDGERLHGFFDRSGLAAARARLAALDEADLARQRWFIRASFATVADAGRGDGHRLAPAAEVPPDLPARALAAARAIGERVARTAIRAGDEASWIGLEPDDHGHWSIEPLGSDPANGLPGVIRFLVALGALTGDRRRRNLADAAEATLRRYLAEEAEDDPPGDDDPSDATPLPDPLLGLVATGDHSLGGGDMGIVDRLLAAAAERDDDDLRDLALRYAAAVVADIERRGPVTGAPLGVETPGWATGLAGIGYGLLRVAAPERVDPAHAPHIAEAMQ